MIAVLLEILTPSRLLSGVKVESVVGGAALTKTANAAIAVLAEHNFIFSVSLIRGASKRDGDDEVF